MVQISMGRTISILFTNEKIKEYDEIFIILAVPLIERRNSHSSKQFSNQWYSMV
jgi:hypothetical protein